MPSADASKATYEQLCSKCHALYPVALHTKAEWSGVVDRMVGYTGADISADDRAPLIY